MKLKESIIKKVETLDTTNLFLLDQLINSIEKKEVDVSQKNFSGYLNIRKILSGKSKTKLSEEIQFLRSDRI